MTPEAPFDPYAILQVVPTAEQEVVHGAYRALAFKYHPDRDATRRAADKMAALNRAYAVLRDERTRAAHDRSRRTDDLRHLGRRDRPPVGRAARLPSPGSVVGFGRYAGWSLRDLARQDPDYLIWLSRHSSGIRYRTEIYGILHTMGRSAA